MWGDLQAPYEVARAKVLVGRAFRDLGDEDSATAELTAALRTFSDLGAIAAGRRSRDCSAGPRRAGSPSANSRSCDWLLLATATP